MPHVISRRLQRDPGIQSFKVPKSAKPVGFLNRGGEPTVYFTADGDGHGTADTAVDLVLTDAGAMTPTGKVVRYIGSAEFSGGQVIFHAWVLPNA